MTVIRHDYLQDVHSGIADAPNSSLAADQWMEPVSSTVVAAQLTSTAESHLPAITIESAAPTYNNPYTLSLQERVAKLQREAPEGFNNSGEGTLAIQSLGQEEKPYTESDLVDENGDLSARATMRNSSGVLEEGIDAGQRERTATLQLLFFSISSSERLDHPGYALEIARQVNMDRDSQRILELAEDVQDPVLRKALKLTVYEQFMQQVDRGYLDVAYADVFGPQEPLADRIKRRNELAQENQREMQEPRAGLDASGQEELARLLPHIASSREFWENVRRTRYDW